MNLKIKKSKDSFVNKISVAGSYKFISPQPLETLILRNKLLTNILNNSHYSAIVIQGPAGHGKTTLLQQFFGRLRARSAKVSWLSLDDADNDITRFNACLRTVVVNALEAQNNTTLTLKEIPNTNGDVENILRLLDLAQAPVAIFIDEFQSITEPVNISLLNAIIERSTPNVTFYIGTRSIPNLIHGKLMISGRVKWVTPEELCFTTEEVLEFLHRSGLELSVLEAEAFRERTGGWPAVLQLLHLALKSGKVNRDTLLNWVSGCQNELTDYLADNVMADQTPEIKHFLLGTSLLTRFFASLSEAVTGEQNAQEMLENLVHQGLFITGLDTEKEWFKYHSIFSSYLSAQLAKSSPDEIICTHLKAAKWLCDNNYLEDAFRHAIKAEDFELAANILNDYSEQLIRSARLQTLEQLCSMLPDWVFKKYPFLCFRHRWAQLFLRLKNRTSNQLENIEHIIVDNKTPAALITSIQILKCTDGFISDDLEVFTYWINKIPIEMCAMSKYRYFEMSAVANLKAVDHLHKGDFTEASRFALLGESLAEQGDSAFSGTYSFTISGYAMILDGRLTQAIKRLKEGFNKKELKIQDSFAMASLLSIYGFALYESGNYIEAESLLRDALDMISQTLPMDFLIPAYISLARASALAENEDYDSLEILDQAEKLGLINKYPRMVRAILRERIRIALLNGNFKEACSIASLPELSEVVKLPKGRIDITEECEDYIISKARMEIHCGEPSKAIEPLSQAIFQATATGRIRRKIKLLILLSLAYTALKKEDKAKKAIYNALALAEPQGYLAVFVDEGSKCLSCLSELLGNTKNDQKIIFISRILQVSGREYETATSGQPDAVLIEKLTTRELEILQLVASGATNAEISNLIFVSYNTVKFHIKNIYGKLGSKNRVNLISYARKLGLI